MIVITVILRIDANLEGEMMMIIMIEKRIFQIIFRHLD